MASGRDLGKSEDDFVDFFRKYLGGMASSYREMRLYDCTNYRNYFCGYTVDRMDFETNTEPQILESKKKELIENVKLSFTEILRIISTSGPISSLLKGTLQDRSKLTCYNHAFNKCSNQCDSACINIWGFECMNTCRIKCSNEYMKQILGEIYDLCITNISKESIQSNPLYKNIHSVTQEKFISKFSTSHNTDTCNLYSTILHEKNIKLVEEIRKLQTTSNTSSSGGKTSRKRSTKKRKQKKSKKSRSKKI